RKPPRFLRRMGPERAPAGLSASNCISLGRGCQGWVWLAELIDGDIEMRGVHLAIPLKLDKYTISSGAGKHNVELDIRPAIGDKGVRVNQVDQVGAGDQHMSPSA